MPGLVHGGVALAAGEQPAIDGTVSTPATASAKARVPQKSSESSPASIAPGIARTIALSMISIVAMLSVSAARATRSPAERQPGPQQRQARQPVAEGEGEHDESTTVAPLENPAAVPIAIPAISPIAQPVRQCRVASTAKAVSSEPRSASRGRAGRAVALALSSYTPLA